MAKNEYLQNYRLRDRDFIDEQIRIDLSQAACFGPNAKFIECQISISSKSTQISFSRSVFQNCVMHFTRKLSKVRFENAQFFNCRFLGTLIDCDFGARDSVTAKDVMNRVIDCDFSEADLRLCRFFNTDITRLKFPSWPNFTIVDYHAIAADIRTSDFRNAKYYSEMLLNVLEPNEVALACYAPDESKTIGCTVDELKDFFHGKPYVIT